MNLTDILITEYRAIDAGATAVAERVGMAHDRLAGVIQRVIGALAALSIAQKAMEFGSKAAAAESSFLSLQARLQGLIGTAQGAKRVLNMDELVAAPSPFTTRQLADASVTLEAYHINAERLIPTIGKLGTAMGAGSEQLSLYTRALGMLASGRMIEMRELADMGMSHKDFQQQGIKFDPEGKLLSSTQDTLAAFERIVNTKFGSILDKMRDTPAAKAASLRDAGDKVMRSIGEGILRAEAPFIESATKVLNALVNSGVLDDVVRKLSGAFNGVFGGDSSEAVARFAAKVLSFLYDLPDALRIVGDFVSGVFHTMMTDGGRLVAYLVSLFQTLGANLGTFFDYLEQRFHTVLTSIGAVLKSILESTWKALKLVGGTIAHELQNSIKDIEQTLHMAADKIGDKGVAAPIYQALPQLPQLDGFKGIGQMQWGSKTDEFTGRLLTALKQPQQGIPDVSGVPLLRGGDQQGQTLLNIQRATEKTAENTKRDLDVRELLFGGGDRARAGVSILDISARSRTAPREKEAVKIEVKTGQASSDLEKAIIDIVRQVVPQLVPLTGTPGYSQ